MNEVRCATNIKEPPWYQWHRFPLVPIIRTRKADHYNTWSCSVFWLCFKYWTKDTPFIKLEFEINDLDIVLRIEPSYLHGGIFIPIFPWWFTQRLWRRPKKLAEDL